MKGNILIMVIAIIYLLFSSNINATSLIKAELPIFAKVVNVSPDDVLNIRISPSYKSNKVGEALPAALLGVNTCRRIHTSTWCNVSTLNHANDIQVGWVNAKFLNLKEKNANRGYVRIKNTPNQCYYSIKCEAKEGVFMCLVASADFDPQTPVTTCTSRKRLTAATAFDSAPKNAVGYCINGRVVNTFYN